MKKILFFLLFFHLIAFGSMNSNTSRLVEKREVIGEGYQNINYTTSSFRITDLGGYDKLTYKFESFGNEFFRKNNIVEPLIVIKQLWVEPIDAVVDRNSKTIVGFNGKCDLKIKSVVGMRSGSRLGGKHTSYPIVLTLKGKRKNSSNYDEIRIEFEMELDVIRTLKVSTTPMDLGTGVQGQKLSSAYGSHGYLNIEGEANKNVVISYPSQVNIFNKTGQGTMRVDIHSPDLLYLGREDYTTRISEKGEKRVVFFGEVRDTRKAPPGRYSGDLKIKVRYN